MDITDLQRSLFVPKVYNGAVLNSGIEYLLVAMDAHIVVNNPKVFKAIKERFNILIDPVTYMLQHTSKREKSSYQGLPYSGVSDVGKIHGDPTYRLDELVKPSIKFQIENGAAIIVAPYLCSEEIHGTIFNTNMTLIGESINHLKSLNSSLPLYAPICTGIDALKEQTTVNAIVDFYTDESIANKVAGYYLMISDLNDRTADIDELLSVASLVYQLSQKKHVIVKQLGAFGYVLNAISNCAFTSSPAGGEVFSLKLMDSKFTPRRDHNEWKYVPELYDYVNDYELSDERIGYKCDCAACTGEFAKLTKTQQRKIHFLLRRDRDVGVLSSLNQHERIDYLSNSFDEAIRFANQCISKGSKLTTQHIYRWSEVLQRARTWNFQEDDKELATFLKALD